MSAAGRCCRKIPAIIGFALGGGIEIRRAQPWGKAWPFRRFRFPCPFSLIHSPRFRTPPVSSGRSHFASLFFIGGKITMEGSSRVDGIANGLVGSMWSGTAAVIDSNGSVQPVGSVGDECRGRQFRFPHGPDLPGACRAAVGRCRRLAGADGPVFRAKATGDLLLGLDWRRRRDPWLATGNRGSIRRECLDHIVVFGEAHLLRILRSYARYYNNIRTHRSLDKDAPVTRPVQRTGRIKSISILGGLHHHCARV
jgi:hypothetical protein